MAESHLNRVDNAGRVVVPHFQGFDWTAGWTTAEFYQVGGQTCR